MKFLNTPMEGKGHADLSFVRLHVHFAPERNMHLNGWIGAVLRNNFLVNASRVLASDGLSLYQHIEELTLAPEHPFYSQLAGGFPKGIWLDCRELAPVDAMLQGGEVYTFSIVMMGWCAQYAQLAVEAVAQMFESGIGSPKVRAQIVEIATDDNRGDSTTKYSDFSLLPDAPPTATVKITYDTPVCLFRRRSKKETSVSYQDKLNGFPSFYQLMRSVVSRCNTLGMLYGDGPLVEDTEGFIASSTEAYLEHANLWYKHLHSTPKQGRNSVYVLEGYQGITVWANVPTQYLPILAFASSLSVGYNIPFGLGAYSMEVQG